MRFILSNAAALFTSRRMVEMCRPEGSAFLGGSALKPTRLHSLNRALL